jgi:hypothetical protein
MSDFTMQLTIREKNGPRSYHRAIDLPLSMFGERLAGEMRAGVAFGGPDAFEKTVSALKERRFRRDNLIATARQLAAQLADYLEDAEGWHGEDRQEATRDQEPKL